MRDLDSLFAALSRSGFRRSFELKGKDLRYLQDKGLVLVLEHARDFIEKRLAPGFISNDGKQTPFRGHPVFVAQHATACCCRGCLEKWHRIPAGKSLADAEIDYVVTVLRHWLEIRVPPATPTGQTRDLFDLLS